MSILQVYKILCTYIASGRLCPLDHVATCPHVICNAKDSSYITFWSTYLNYSNVIIIVAIAIQIIKTVVTISVNAVVCYISDFYLLLTSLIREISPFRPYREKSLG